MVEKLMELSLDQLMDIFDENTREAEEDYLLSLNEKINKE